jgi:hypothetical protein
MRKPFKHTAANSAQMRHALYWEAKAATRRQALIDAGLSPDHGEPPPLTKAQIAEGRGTTHLTFSKTRV